MYYKSREIKKPKGFKMIKTETFLPGFSGFYGTVHEFNDDAIQADDIIGDIEDAINIHTNGTVTPTGNIDIPSSIDLDELYEVDYAQYSEDYVQAYTDVVEQFIVENGLKVKFTYQSTYSPKFYNFSNDSINIECEYDPSDVVDILEENYERFQKYIEERYTSRDGFSSSYSNDADEWLNGIRENGFGDHELGVSLEFILELNDFDEYEDGAEPTREAGNIYESSYLTVKEFDIDEETAGLLKEISDAIEKGGEQMKTYSDTMPADSSQRQREGHSENIKTLEQEYAEILLNSITD